MTPTRRHVLRLAAASLVLPASALAAPKRRQPTPADIPPAKPRVVVVGGGAGGATLARLLQKGSSGRIDVTLVEPRANYTTCFFSNLVIGGIRDLASLTFSYDKLKAEGINVIVASAAAIDRDNKVVVVTDKRVPYDRLVLSPGVDLKFDSVPGYSPSAATMMPHAWTSGAQVELLIKKLNALEDGDTIVVIAPPNPARCPPAVYERVSMFARALKGKGHMKSKIIVLDTKPSFPLQPLFQESWEKYVPGMIEWQDPQMHGGIKRVDAAKGEIVTDLATYKAALANVIPAQMADKIARDAGLVDETGFCPVDADNMKSARDRNIFVLGDAANAGEMPKSAASAVSQAAVAAHELLREFADARPAQARYDGTCWSFLDAEDAVKIAGTYAPEGRRIRQATSDLSQPGESAALRSANAENARAWYDGIVAGMFG